MERLEPRLVLASTPAADTDPLTAAQTAALVQGIDVLAQRLTQFQTAGLFGQEAAGLGESIGTLSPIGDQLRTGLAERLSSLSGAITVLDVKNAFTAAAAADPVLAISSVSAIREALGDQTRLWFSVPLAGTTPLPTYQLSLGQTPSATATPSLLDAGLRLSDVKPTVSVGYDGTMQFGIDLAPGLTAEQGFFIKFDNFDVFAKASASGASAVQDVEANFGIMRLGPSDVDVSLDTRVRVNLVEGADGVVSLGELDGTATPDLGTLFSLSAAGSGLAVTVPFKLGFGGFQQPVGSTQTITIKAGDLFDPASLSVTPPKLQFSGGSTAFDFTKLADITDHDLGAFVADLGHWVPNLGDDFQVPIIDRPLSSVAGSGITDRITSLVSGLKNTAGNWAFTTADDLVDKLAAALGRPVADFDLRWNPAADAVQWTLPLSHTETLSESFDADQIVPAGLPLAVAGKGAATVTVTTALAITSGVSVKSATGVPAVTSATLVSSLNGGAGLTKNALVTGNDLEFRLRNGTKVGFDLDTLTGLGTDSLPGTATVADLLTLLNGPAATGKFSVTLAGNSLVANDLTTPASKEATFSIVGPSVTVMAGTTTTVQSSLAPAVLGLSAVPAAAATIEGKPLAVQPLRDRIYVAAGDAATAAVSIAATLEAGASLGPLALSIHAGEASASAGITIKLADPGVGAAADGRITLAEMDAAGGSIVGFKVAAPSVTGIFQIKVRPESLASGPLGIVDANYKATPLATPPASADVPFIKLAVDAATPWGFAITTSDKMKEAVQGLADLSLDDLPAMLTLFADYLKDAPFWDVQIPWDGRTLGQVLAIDGVVSAFQEFDLSAVLGRPVGGVWPAGSFNGLADAFIDAIDVKLASLSGLPGFSRLQRLSWSLSDLMVRWDGWTPGVDGFDVSFIADLRAWAVEANLVFASLPADPAIIDVRLAFGRLLAFDATKDTAWLGGLDLAHLDLDGLDLGALDRFGTVIEGLFGGLFPAASGVSVTVLPSLASVTPGGAKALVFDTTITYAGFTAAVDLDALSLGDGTPITVSGTGDLKITIAGTAAGRFGLNLSTAAPFFDATKSSISLEAGIDDGTGLTLKASVGGIAGISLGSNAAGAQKATVSLTRQGSASPAVFAINGAGTVTADGKFVADLPLYITGMGIAGSGEGLGALALTATLDTAATPPFAVTAGFVPDAGSEFQSLADIFSAAAFSLDSWLEGAILFTQTLRTAFETDFVRDLPLLGEISTGSVAVLNDLEDFFQAIAAFDTPKKLAAELENRVAATGLTATFTFYVNGTEISKTSETTFSSLIDDLADEFVLDITLSGSSTTTIDVGTIDLGLDALGLELRGGLGIDLLAGFSAHVGLGYGRSRGFFLETKAGDELSGTVALALAESATLSMQLGALVLSLEDRTKGPITDPTKRELEATLALDLETKKSSVADLPALFSGAKVSGTVRAELGVDLTAAIFEGGPGIGMALTMGYTSDATPAGVGVSLASLSANNFFFEITDTYIDLGGLLSGPVATLFDRIENFLDPIEPILDTLKGEVPVISDVAEFAGLGPITVLDVIRYTSQGEYDNAILFIELLTIINDVAGELAGTTGSAKVSLGKLEFDRDAAAGGNVEELFAKGSAVAESLISGLTGGLGSDTAASPTDVGGSIGSTYSKVTEGKVTFPIFDDPAAALIDLIFGRNPMLVHWDMPDLLAGASFNLTIPIFGPLFAEIFGGLAFATDFSMGYDTRGLRQVLAGDTIAPEKIVNGVFFGDDPTPGDGDDPLEVRLDATVGAGAYVDVFVAAAGVKGGVEGYVGANLKDPNDDGRVHLDEFLKNLSNGVECIFDFEGRLDAFFDAWIKVGFSTPFGFVTLWSDTYELARANLVDWEYVTCPPPEPEVAEVIGGGVYDHDDNAGTAAIAFPGGKTQALVLNAGPRAGRVLEGETTDGDEVFEVDYDSVTNRFIVKAYYAEEDRNSNGVIDESEKGNGKSYSAVGVEAIVFDAGLGNDTVIFTANVAVPVYGYGGAGNDKLIGGSAANTLSGDGGAAGGTAGADRLEGRGAGDTLAGGGGNDVVIGNGGSDTIRGDDGDDQLFAGDESGGGDAAATINAVYGGTGNDRLTGATGNDLLSGDSGDDTIDGGEGNDSIEGGEGNDKLYGRGGDDTIWGDDIADLLTAGAIDVNADLIEGGTGYNVIYGGPGFDAIFAADEELKAAAPSTGTSGGWSSRLSGGDGNDTIYGTGGKDWIAGGFDSDYVESGTGDDDVFGGPGGDCLIAAGGNARIFGGHGNDVIDGGDGVNFIEGGPGDDRIYARGGADIVYGGTTGVGYAFLLDDLAQGKPVIAAIHGGFTAVTAEGSCGPDVMFHPEVYPDAPFQLTGTIFTDLDADGIRDAGEPLAPAGDSWTIRIVDKATFTDVMIATVPGGGFTLPEGSGLPAGTYLIIVDAIPAGWSASGWASVLAEVTLGGASPPAAPDLGFFKPGQLRGKVTTKSGSQVAPAVGVSVFLDGDQDGAADPGEPVVLTGTNGTYAFTDLFPGSYRVAILDATTCANVQPDFRDAVLVSGGSSTSYDFEIYPATAPVVDAVLLAKPGNAITWIPVPDGADQLDPIAGTFSLIAFETCIGEGRIAATSGATLLPVSPTGSLGTAIPLTFLGADPTQATRFIYQVSSVTGATALNVGRYRLVVDDTSVTSNTGAVLDGNWTNPSSNFPFGSQYPSGNGTAGGDFIFDFVVAGTANLAAVLFDSTSWTPVPSGTAGGATIQGTVWRHDEAGTDLGRTLHEPGINGQVVKLKSAGGQTVATVTTAPIDLDGDGTVEPAEQGAFRFTGVDAATYTVVQEPVVPWVQATPGGVFVPETLHAVSHTAALGKNTLWTIDTATLAATRVRDFQTLVARDVTFTTRDTAYLSGMSVSTGTSSPSVPGLWRMDVPTGALVSLGEVPGGQPLFSLDTLDAGTLLGISRTGEVLLYRIADGAWESRGTLLTASNGRLYPVGDAVVVAPNEIYIVCLGQTLDTMNVQLAPSQVLIRLDATVLGANASLVREFRTVTELLVGLERDAAGNLVAVGTGNGLYSFAASAAGSVTRTGTLVGATAFTYGGLAMAPATTVLDTGRTDFLVSVTGSETVNVGFGDVPDWHVLEDGDDTIDGGCGTDNDVLYGDDGSGLPWYVKTVGGHDFIRGRDGDDQIAGGQQGDVILGEKGNDLILGGDSAVNRLDGGDGNDSITGGPLADVITGGDGADTLQGNAGDDTIFGDAGDDILFGGDGGDALIGGAGQDNVIGEAGDDTLYVIDVVLGGGFAANPGTLADTYVGGGGTDTLVVRADTNAALTNADLKVFGAAHMLGSIEIAFLTGGASPNTIDAGSFAGRTTIRGLGGADTLTGGTSIDLILGEKGNDVIVGNGGDDDLRGEDDDDQISGDAGLDAIRGGGGRNTLTGGADSDTFIFEGTFDDRVVELAGGGGNDVLDMTAISASLVATIDAAATGTRIYASSPMLAVEWTNDQIERIGLGAGDDIVYLKKTGATAARLDAGTGQDLLSYASYGSTWAANVTVNLTTGSATGVAGGIAGFDDITGGDGGDTLTGDAGPNTIFGGGGGDVISGSAGNDVLYGEDGNDTLAGGADDDMLAGGGGTNTLGGGLGNDTYAFYAAGASDTVNEAAGQGTDLLDFAYVSGSGIDAAISGTIAVTYGTSTTSVPTTAGIDRVRGTAQSDRFRVADAAAYAGILDGYATATLAFADMDILDLSAWTAPVTVSYLGALDASFVGSATGTGGVVNLRHVIGGTKGDTLRAGGLPVWFEGRAGNDLLSGSIQDDLLDGGNDADTLFGGYGNDTLKGGWGSDTLGGGPGNDTYSFADLFGTDTIIEDPGDGTDTMDFSAVLSALTVSLGSVTVTAPGASATHAGSAVERVVGGAGDDTFVMTGPSVTFPGTLDGGGGTNTLRYDNATPTIVSQVNKGLTPNVGVALKFDTVAAVPAYTPVDLTVPALSTVTDGITRTGNQRIVKQGSGKLILSLANSHTEGTSVEAGELVVKNVAALGTGGLEIAAGAKASLDVGAVGIKIGFIKFDGLLDIDRATLTVASGMTQASLVAGLLAGRGDGSWNGANGITSGPASAAVAAGIPRAIGWIDNGDGSFTMQFTATGDSDLDGSVDILDVANFTAGGRFNAGPGSDWSGGDFNYDGYVDILDIPDFVAAYVSQNAAQNQAAAAPQGTAIQLSGMSPLDAAFAAFAGSTSGSTGETSTRKKRTAL